MAAPVEVPCFVYVLHLLLYFCSNRLGVNAVVSQDVGGCRIRRETYLRRFGIQYGDVLIRFNRLRQSTCDR